MSLFGIRAAVGVFALAAAGISAYLVTVHYSGGPVVCFAGGGCETVQTSEYAQLGGVPLSVLGLAAYLGLAATAAFRGELAALAGFALGLSVGIFAVYLIVVQAAVLDAVCVWCLASDAIALVLAGLGVVRLRAEPVAPVRE